MKRLIFFLLAYFLFFTLFAGDSIRGKVKAVIDGNTLEVETSDQDVQIIQLAGIDSPELGQEFGDHAKDHLSKITLQKTVQVTIVGKDRKGNLLATVLINGKDIRVELLKEGLAWTAEKNPLPELESVKEIAKQNAKGLWIQENPTPPWVYRRQQSMLQVKGS
ncbi:MAG: thermonuclease family protein [Cyclobacteriaceae bacterium]